MQRQSLRSSSVKSAGYDASRRQLEVELSGGQVMLFHSVPQAEFDGLLRAANPQSYYRDRIEEEYTGERVRS